VGFDGSQTEFNTVEKTGGEKAHTLLESEVPDHTHYSGTLGTSSDGAHDHELTFSSATGSSQSNVPRGTGTEIGRGAAAVVDSATHSHGITGQTGVTVGTNNQPHNNLQPYITVYMWKRTA
jgi:microcystin-dependent protein